MKFKNFVLKATIICLSGSLYAQSPKNGGRIGSAE